MISAAEATRTLHVGTFVVNNDFRHPVLLAREAAAVDLLTEGRLELGLGARHLRSEHEQAGIPFDPASVRIERLGEAVAIVKALLEGKTANLAGKHYRVAGHCIHPLPLQKPRPPILIGGNGRRLLSLAAREADIVGFTGLGHRRGGADIDISGFRAAALERARGRGERRLDAAAEGRQDRDRDHRHQRQDQAVLHHPPALLRLEAGRDTKQLIHRSIFSRPHCRPPRGV